MEINFEDYSSYKIIDVSVICENESCFCKHFVTIEINNSKLKFDGILYGEIIANYYQYHKMDIPLHYQKFISSNNILN